eukprot:SAG31_NODE_86_length_26973_cov_16.850897_19_plen_39_part_00
MRPRIVITTFVVGQSPNVWCLVVFIEMSDLVFGVRYDV